MPRITTLAVPKDKIREIIGTGGKVIRGTAEDNQHKIDVDDDGTIKVAAVDADAAEAKAIDWIRGIVAEPELGVIYNGKVVKVVDFGAFVNFLGAKDGLVHISELAQQRVGKTADVVKVGDPVKVKVRGFDDRGKVKLSRRQVDQATGEVLGPAPGAAGPGRRRREVTPGSAASWRHPGGGRDLDRRLHPVEEWAPAFAAVALLALNLPLVIGHRGAAAYARRTPGRAPQGTRAGLRLG